MNTVEYCNVCGGMLRAFGRLETLQGDGITLELRMKGNNFKTVRAKQTL
jgi:hypothetical protein